MDALSSSPPNASSTPQDALAYYKAQYELLESELADFQASSQELEAELEKDVEAAEKRERALREKVEGLGFEVDEWKTKYKQAKTEANSAQNVLQKEITTLRDANRTLQLKLRDIEVENDDFEKQARNTTSSLEDLESKFNVSIERNVMLEEEIKMGEQERENLRIETQRLRDELGDLKIEAEIMQDKLKKHKNLPSISTSFGDHSHTYDESPTSTTASSPIVTTPPDSKSVSTVDTISETPTPPSPPRFVDSIKREPSARTSMRPPSRIRQPSMDLSSTPKPRNFSRHSDLYRVPSSAARTIPSAVRDSTRKSTATRGMTNSTSLTHIRSLTAQMQRLEQRVHHARSKLPPQTPGASPRTASASSNHMPPSVTIRSRKRTGGSTASNTSLDLPTPSGTGTSRHVSRPSASGISRLSFGPPPKRENTESETSVSSRPSSRASGSVYSRGERPVSRAAAERPPSRASMTGSRTPMGHYSQSTIAESRRPRSSMGGSYPALPSQNHGHGHSQSVNYIDRDIEEEADFKTPPRRNSVLKGAESGIPTPSGIPRRSSTVAVGGPVGGRRTSSSLGFREGERRLTNGRKLSGVGETY